MAEDEESEIVVVVSARSCFPRKRVNGPPSCCSLPLKPCPALPLQVNAYLHSDTGGNRLRQRTYRGERELVPPRPPVCGVLCLAVLPALLAVHP